MIFNTILLLTIILLYLFIFSIRNMPINVKKRSFLLISFIIIVFLMSTRTFSTGTDTRMYISFFEKVSNYKFNLKIIGNYYEPLFIIINILLSYISSNPRFFIIVTSSIICYAFYTLIKKNSKNYFLSVLIFIGLLFFYSTMNTIRQYLAISIIIFGYNFIKNKKILPYMICVVLATLMHSSALVGILIYPLYNMKYNRFRVIIIFLIAIVSNIFISDLINNIYTILNRTNYYEYRIGKENISNLIHMILYLIIYLFSLYLTKKNKINNEGHNSFYLYIFIMTSAFSLIAMNLNVLSRATTYFNIFSIICIPNVIEENIKNRKNKFIITIVLILFLFIYSNVIIYLRPEWNTAFNYKNSIIQKTQ